MASLVENAAQSLDRAGLGRRAQLLMVGAVTLLALWGVYRWATTAPWVPASSGLDLQSVSRVTARLDEESIEWRLERGGAEVQVRADNLASARIALAEEGLPAGERPGWGIFDEPQWGMTDFTQRVNYRRALEGELERTIGEMAGIESAKVHLTLQETSAFRRADQQSEASVVLRFHRGTYPDDGMVRAITSLLASSVGGLTTDQVTVLDGSRSRTLTSAVESGVGGALTSRQLESQLEVERHLETKAARLLDQMMGPGNADVQVSARLNFDQLARTTQAVDPEGQVIASEERAEVIPSEGSTGAASVQSSSEFETTRSVEQFTQAAGAIARLTIAVMVNATPLGTDGAPTTAPTPGDLTLIETLVRNSVGFDAARGDAISVQAAPFSVPLALGPSDAPGGGLMEMLQFLIKPLLAVLGFALAFMLALRTLRTVREVEPAPAAALPTSSADPVRALADRAAEALPARSSPRDLARRVVDNPQLAARAAGAWLSDG